MLVKVVSTAAPAVAGGYAPAGAIVWPGGDDGDADANGGR
jgi:hypothetical protein